MKKDKYFFSHDFNARYDPKIICLIHKYGLIGYSYYFILLEILREQKDYCFDLDLINSLSFEWCITSNSDGKSEKEKTEEIINFLIEVGLVVKIKKNKKTFIFSRSFLNRMEEYDTKKKNYQKAGSIGGKTTQEKNKQRLSNAKAPLDQKTSNAKAIILDNIILDNNTFLSKDKNDSQSSLDEKNKEINIQIGAIMKLFKQSNPTLQYENKTQRGAIKRMIENKAIGYEQILKGIC